MGDEEFELLHVEIEATANALRAKAAEIYELAEGIEELTEDTDAWYAATRARIEAKAALGQAEDLRRVLEELGERPSFSSSDTMGPRCD